MSKRIIEISREAGYLKFKNHQLIIERNGDNVASIPIEDVSVVIMDNPQCTITQVCMRELAKEQVMLVCSDERHMPNGLLLPLDGHSLQGERFVNQANLAKPTQKQLWKQVVCAKVSMQAKVLSNITGSDAGIKQLKRKVRSGDPDNIEAQAAKRYWPRLFEDSEFRRNRYAEDQNRFLNYGYAILRAIVARSIVATGLHPCLGINHKNKYNAYPLADDLMEPYRPFIDLITWQLVQHYPEHTEIVQHVKKELLSMVKFSVTLAGEVYTLQGAITKTAQSLSKVVMGDGDKLLLPNG